MNEKINCGEVFETNSVVNRISKYFFYFFQP